MAKKRKTFKLKISTQRDQWIANTGHPWPRAVTIPNKRLKALRELGRKKVSEKEILDLT